MRNIFFLVAVVCLTACASITSPKTDSIRVESNPDGGTIEVACDGQTVFTGTTPTSFELNRRAGDCDVTIGKQGWVSRSVRLEQGMNAAIWWNLLPLGVGLVTFASGDVLDESSGESFVVGAGATALGFILDWAGGMSSDHDPKIVRVTLEPVDEKPR